MPKIDIKETPEEIVISGEIPGTLPSSFPQLATSTNP